RASPREPTSRPRRVQVSDDLTERHVPRMWASGSASGRWRGGASAPLQRPARVLRNKSPTVPPPSASETSFSSARYLVIHQDPTAVSPQLIGAGVLSLAVVRPSGRNNAEPLRHSPRARS